MIVEHARTKRKLVKLASTISHIQTCVFKYNIIAIIGKGNKPNNLLEEGVAKAHRDSV